MQHTRISTSRSKDDHRKRENQKIERDNSEKINTRTTEKMHCLHDLRTLDDDVINLTDSSARRRAKRQTLLISTRKIRITYIIQDIRLTRWWNSDDMNQINRSCRRANSRLEKNLGRRHEECEHEWWLQRFLIKWQSRDKSHIVLSSTKRSSNSNKIKRQMTYSINKKEETMFSDKNCDHFQALYFSADEEGRRSE